MYSYIILLIVLILILSTMSSYEKFGVPTTTTLAPTTTTTLAPKKVDLSGVWIDNGDNNTYKFDKMGNSHNYDIYIQLTDRKKNFYWDLYNIHHYPYTLKDIGSNVYEISTKYLNKKYTGLIINDLNTVLSNGKDTLTRKT